MFIKQSTAYTFRFGPFLDDTDGKTAETGLTIEDSHIRVSKAGANFIDKNETTNAAHDEAGFYVVILDATDTNAVGELQIAVHVSGALPVFKTFQVVEEAIYDALFGASATLAASVASVLADTAELQTDWVNGGRLDLLVDSVISKVDVIDGIVDDILVDTGTTIPGTITTIDNFLDTEIAAILADTNELQADWVNGGRLDLLLDAVLADTAELQTDLANGGRLDLLVDSIIAKVDVVDGIVDNILVDTAEIGTAGAGLTALWTTAQTESYASDGAAATPAQLLYMIYCTVGEFSIADTTITGKKVDGSTTAMTWTINSASSPTSRTRAS